MSDRLSIATATVRAEPYTQPNELPIGANDTPAPAPQEVEVSLEARRLVSMQARQPGSGMLRPGPVGVRTLGSQTQRALGASSLSTPPQAGGYRVQVGDTLASIAREAQVDIADLRAANPALSGDRLVAGRDVLQLPPNAVVPGPRAALVPPQEANGAWPGTRPGNPYAQQFAKAAQTAGVPASWANNPSMMQLVKHESSFKPTAKNPTSSAFGLFQMTKDTWKAYLPEAPHGTQDPYWQAVGGFRYIEAEYGTPENAWLFWQATVNRNPNLLPPGRLRNKAKVWVGKGYQGY